VPERKDRGVGVRGNGDGEEGEKPRINFRVFCEMKGEKEGVILSPNVLPIKGENEEKRIALTNSSAT